jgi:hypothetical protein
VTRVAYAPLALGAASVAAAFWSAPVATACGIGGLAAMLLSRVALASSWRAFALRWLGALLSTIGLVMAVGIWAVVSVGVLVILFGRQLA